MMGTSEKDLSLALDAATQQLRIRYEPADEATPPAKGDVGELLEQGGYAGYALDDAAIAAFVEQCREATGPVDAVIGEARDGSFDIVVSDSRMEAWLSLVAPRGGRAVSMEQIEEAIRVRQIVHGVKRAELEAALAAGACEHVLIAEGEEPEQGTPAYFDSLLESLKASGHEHDDDEVVDYRDLGNLVVVDPGTPLMRRHPAVQGRNGVDVFNRTVPARPVADTPFARLNGAEPDANDADLLLSTIAGAPSLQANGVVVNPLVDVQDVNLETGNIDFDGTVQVKGDIKAGMTVRVAGDVVVSGTLEAAEVVAGGNVVVKGGIIGKADSAPGGGALETARIRCNGSVQAKFIEHAVIEAAGSIQADGGIRQSELTAGDCVVVGKPGSNQGSLIGGRTRALRLVRAPVLGAPSGVPTLVQVGFNPFINAERAALEQTRKRKLDEALKLRQLLAFLDKNPAKGGGGVRAKAENTLGLLENEAASIEGKLRELEGFLELAEGASVEVPKRIYGGVRLQIGQKLVQVDDEKPGARFRMVDGQIAVG